MTVCGEGIKGTFGKVYEGIRKLYWKVKRDWGKWKTFGELWKHYTGREAAIKSVKRHNQRISTLKKSRRERKKNAKWKWKKRKTAENWFRKTDAEDWN